MIKRISLISIVLATLVTLTACGFHLRGIWGVPHALHTLYVKSDKPYSDFMSAFKKHLKQGKINVVDKANKAPYKLVVSHAKTSINQTSTAASQQLRQYEVKFRGHFALVDDKNQPVVPPFTIHESQKQTFSADKLPQNTPQISQLKQDIYRKVSNQIIDHLSSTSVRNAISNYQKTVKS